jgi:hypothetical protein
MPGGGTVSRHAAAAIERNRLCPTDDGVAGAEIEAKSALGLPFTFIT